MGLSDSRPEPFPRLFIPSGRLGSVALPPPCRVSQVPRLIYSCALVPNHPERSGECLLIASPPISGFILSGGLATFNSVTRPNRVRLRYGSQVCFPGFRQPDYADSLRFSYMHERAIYMVNSFQFTRSARLSLVYQTTQAKPHHIELQHRGKGRSPIQPNHFVARLNQCDEFGRSDTHGPSKVIHSHPAILPSLSNTALHLHPPGI